MGLDINIENAAFHVEYKHPITKLALDVFRNTYRSVNYFCEADKIKYKLFTWFWNNRKDIWGYNGPQLFTRILKQWCGTDDISLMIIGNGCNEFRVLPPESFYPISWLESRLEKVLCCIQDVPGMEQRSDRDPRMEQNERSTTCLKVFRPSLRPDCSHSVSALVRNCARSILINMILKRGYELNNFPVSDILFPCLSFPLLSTPRLKTNL